MEADRRRGRWKMKEKNKGGRVFKEEAGETGTDGACGTGRVLKYVS